MKGKKEYAIIVKNKGEKQILTAEKSIDNFNAKLNDLIKSKYILADSKAGDVLKAIAGSDVLYQIFEYVTENFDYKAYKSVCFTYSEGEEGFFTLPPKEEDVLALVFLLLMEVDAKKEDLFIICDKYFYSSNGKQASYELFAEKVLVPFGEIVNKTAYRLINAENPNSAPSSKQRTAECEDIEKSLKQEIEKAKIISIDFYDEAEFTLSRIIEAINSNRNEDAALGYIALKYMWQSEEKNGLNFDEIAKIMKGALK